MTWPVTLDTDSSVPVTGASTTVLNHLMRGRVSAIGAPAVTGSPSFTSM